MRPDLSAVRAATDTHVQARLEAEAQESADRAGVEVRDLRLDDAHAASALFDEVWRAGPGRSPMEPGLIVALEHAGNYCAGAFAGDTLVGACVGFFGTPLGEVLHSHIAAVSPAARPGTGSALKRHQRAWCHRRGLSTIAWTYDPLIARNAWFNLSRLGAHPVEYLVDFYGEMDDGLNVGQGSDRLLVQWPVAPAGLGNADPFGALRQAQGPARARGAVAAALSVGPDQAPVPVAVADGVRVCTLAVPTDIEGLRAGDPALGARWRRAFRNAYLDLTSQGWHLTGFERDGRYVMERG